uniref:FBA_2 domain-containing protein n=2 Tax=Caenorhabditis tropicalis TaxID=1561998 RepID=A0A1I7UX72_9PELO
MESSFQLLRLPQLAIAEVLNLLSMKEQVLFSLSSSKAETLFKFLRNKQLKPNLVIALYYWIGNYVHQNQTLSEILIHVGSELERFCGRVEKVKMGNQLVDLWIEDKNEEFYLKTYWQDFEIGILVISDYICNLFEVGIFLFELRTEHLKMMDMLEGTTIETLHIYDYCREIDENGLNYILSKAKAKYLFICISLESFQLNAHHKNHFDSLIVDKASWVTIDFLMSLDCIEIRIRERRFSNEELNRFLMHWINGGSPRLKCFVADADIWFFKEELALKGINVQKTKEHTRIYKSPSKDLEFENQEIRRNDGIIASIKYSNGVFSFGVWPDCDDTLHRSIIIVGMGKSNWK